MEKISPPLRERLQAAGPGAVLRLIVTLAEAADWEEGVGRLREAGLEPAGGEAALRTVFGQAPAAAVPRLAALPAVRLVELDEEAAAL